MNPPIETVQTISLEPEWPALARWYCRGLATHSFDAGAKEPIAAFIEIIRYLAIENPDELKKILEEQKA